MAVYASALLVTWYDQSGNDNDTETSPASAAPTYSANGMNGKPTFTYTSGNTRLRTTENVTASVGLTGFSVVDTTGASGLIRLDTDADDGLSFWPTVSAPLISISDSGGDSAGADFENVVEAPSVVDAVASSAVGQSAAAVNGASLTIDNDVATGTAVGEVSGISTVQLFTDAKLSELILYSGIKTRTAVRENEGTYYGIDVTP
jgi:hypothetical protein